MLDPDSMRRRMSHSFATFVAASLNRIRALAWSSGAARSPASSARVAIEFGLERMHALRVVAGRIERSQSVPVRAPDRGAALKRLRRAGWFDQAEVALMLGIGQRQLNTTPRPAVEDADLRDAVRWQLHGALDYPLEEAVIDPLPVADTEPAGRQEILVFSIRRQELSGLMAPFAQAGVRLARVATVDCAQRNLAWHHAPGQAAVAVLFPCEGGALCTVSRGEQLILSRAIEVDERTLQDPRALSLAAERIALQLQRAFDLLERRSADAGVTSVIAADWGPKAGLIEQVCALASQRVFHYQPAALSADLDLSDSLHLLGACLIDAPTDPAPDVLRAAPRVSGLTERLESAFSLSEREPRPESATFELDAAAVHRGMVPEKDPDLPSLEPAAIVPLNTGIEPFVLVDPREALAEEMRLLAQARAALGGSTAFRSEPNPPESSRPESLPPLAFEPLLEPAAQPTVSPPEPTPNRLELLP